MAAAATIARPITVSEDFDTEEWDAIRYNVKPEGLESGTLSMGTKSANSCQTSFEYQVNNKGDPVYYSGPQQAAKEVDCVLLWDEQTSSYVLHSLSTFTRLAKQRTKPNLAIAVSNSAPASPASSPRFNKPSAPSSPALPAQPIGVPPARASSPLPQAAQRSTSQHRPMASPRMAPTPSRLQKAADSSSSEDDQDEEDSSSDEEDDMAANLEAAVSQPRKPQPASAYLSKFAS